MVIISTRGTGILSVWVFLQHAEGNHRGMLILGDGFEVTFLMRYFARTTYTPEGYKPDGC